MIRRLIILLLIVGCEEPSQHGCLDGQATNYDATASIDNNFCTYIDSCGVVDIDLTNDCVKDECGVWGGDGAEENYDCDGNCEYKIDCLGECGGSAVIDDCDVCNGNNTTCSRCRVEEKLVHYYMEPIINITDSCYDNISEEQCHEYYQPENCFTDELAFPGTQCTSAEIFYEQGSCENYDGN